MRNLFRLFMLFAAFAVHAQSITSNPSQIQLPPGLAHGTTTLSWIVEPQQWIAITLVNADGTESGIRGAVGSGSETINWIAANQTYRFRLRPALPPLGAADLSRLLGETVVSATNSQQSLTANPSQILLPPGSTLGSTTLSWIVESQQWIAITLVNADGTESGIHGAVGSGSETINWIAANQTYRFRLRPALPPFGAADLSRLLGETVVSARSSQQSLTANPGQILLPPGSTQGTTTLSWIVDPQQWIAITLVLADGTEAGIRGAVGSGSETINWIAANQTYRFRLRPALPPFGAADLSVLLSETVVSAVSTGSPRDSQFESIQVSSSLNAGQVSQATVVFRNTGTLPWNRQQGFRLGAVNDETTWGIVRVELPFDVNPGQSVSVTFSFTAPSAPGNYEFRWRMIQEGVAWFGEASTPRTILVTAPNETSRIGGSNYIYYKIDCAAHPQCRTPFGITDNYDEQGVRDTVRAQLAQMYANGQRKLRVPVPHCEGEFCFDTVDEVAWRFQGDRGSLVNPIYKTNLANFLSDVKAAGFDEIVLWFVFLRDLNPAVWTCDNGTDPGKVSCNENVEKHFSVIRDIRNVAKESGLRYLLDLTNEGMLSRFELGTRAGRNVDFFNKGVWSRYSSQFGVEDSLGFSFALDQNSVLVRARLDYIFSLYGTGPLPSHLDLHIYGTNELSEDATIRIVATWLRENRLSKQRIIIGETWYNDATSARNFRQAIDETGLNVRYLLQWPVNRVNPTQCGVIAFELCPVPPPFTFDAFRFEGF